MIGDGLDDNGPLIELDDNDEMVRREEDDHDHNYNVMLSLWKLILFFVLFDGSSDWIMIERMMKYWFIFINKMIITI